jgi:acyl dehydratase
MPEEGTVTSVITDEMKAAIGKKGKPVTHLIEKGAVRRFAQAIGDPNPLWNDEAKARKTRYGGMVVPPTFFCSLAGDPAAMRINLPYTRRLNGGDEWEYFQPVHVGDRITVVSELADLYERKGSLGNMLFVITKQTYTNQFGEKVAIHKNTLITY